MRRTFGIAFVWLMMPLIAVGFIAAFIVDLIKLGWGFGQTFMDWWIA